MLAVPTLLRSIEFYSRWGAVGKVRYLKKLYAKELNAQKVVESQDMGVQTEDDVLPATTYEKSSAAWDITSSSIRSDASIKESSLMDDDVNSNQQLTATTAPDSIHSSNNEAIIMDEEVTVMKEEALFSLDMIDLTSIIKSTQGTIHISILNY